MNQENYEYVIGCKVNEQMQDLILEHINEKNIQSIRFVDVSSLSEEEIDNLHIDNLIFENDGDMSNIDLIEKLRTTNSHMTATAIDYYQEEKETVKKVYDTIVETGVIVIPAPINITNEETLNKSTHYFLANVDNTYRQQIVDREKVQEQSQKAKGIDANEDMELANAVNIAKNVIEVTGHKDAYTRGHVERVSYLSEILAFRGNKDPYEVNMLACMTSLHDVGKIITPNSILKANTELEDEQKKIMDNHVNVGSGILKKLFGDIYGKNISDKMQEKIDRISSAVEGHHVRYEKETKHDPLIGILQIADSFDAATSDRGYNLPKTLGEMLVDIAANAGKQFNPDEAKNFIKYMTGEEITDEKLQEYAALNIDRDDSVEQMKEKLIRQETLVLPEVKEELEQFLDTHFIDLKEKVLQFSDRFNPKFDKDKKLFEAVKSYVEEQGIEVTQEMLSQDEFDKSKQEDLSNVQEGKKQGIIKNLYNRLSSMFKGNKKMLPEAKEEPNEQTNIEDTASAFKSSLNDQVNQEISDNSEELLDKNSKIIDDPNQEIV